MKKTLYLKSWFDSENNGWRAAVGYYTAKRHVWKPVGWDFCVFTSQDKAIQALATRYPQAIFEN